MAEQRYESVAVHGPFWRSANSRTQDREGMRRIIKSGELWGRPPAFSDIPAVQAYHGPLPADKQGVEFYALTPPDRPFGPPCWRERDDESVRVDDDIAKVKIVLSRVDQDY